MTNYDEAAKRANALLSERAPREELLPAVEEALRLAPKGSTGVWERLAKELREGREVRMKETA